MEKAENFYVDSTPNATKTLEALRDTGYDAYTAIMDIVDNSIDADAKKIEVTVVKRGDNISISIADDGVGMGAEVLKEAVKLGSDTKKDIEYDLGKYGMGLVTASIAIGRSFEVVTKKEGSDYLYALHDLDYMEEVGAFRTLHKPATDNQETTFCHMVGAGKTGTVITISKIDNMPTVDITQFVNTLTKKLGEVFRKFISADTELLINGKKVEAVDPITLGYKDTEVFSEDTYNFKDAGKTYPIYAKICILPEFGVQKNRSEGINQKNQGFYLMRNNRQIAAGKHFDLFEKHNSKNRIRIELGFDATLDKNFGIRFKKDGISMKDKLKDFIRQEIGSQLKTIANRIKKSEISTNTEKQVDFTEIESNIAKKSRLLPSLKTKIEKRNTTTADADKDETKKDDKEKNPYIRKNYTEDQLSKTKKAKFEFIEKGSTGPLYECELVGKMVVVKWNIEHPFYEHIIYPNRDNKETHIGVNYLVYSLAFAELKDFDEETQEVAENFRATLSNNLRILFG